MFNMLYPYPNACTRQDGQADEFMFEVRGWWQRALRFECRLCVAVVSMKYCGNYKYSSRRTGTVVEYKQEYWHAQRRIFASAEANPQSSTIFILEIESNFNLNFV
jgi:hypothetical protein